MTRTDFPARGRGWQAVAAEMEEGHAGDLPVHNARQFKPAYFAGDDVLEVALKAFEMHAEANVLYSASAYPSLARYEAELVDMVLGILHAPEGAGGSVTSGGTESNMMAVKTARDRARAERPDITRPEMVVPQTAHPSFTKAAELLGLGITRLDRSVDFQADVEAMERAINENTIMLVASAPPYGYGVIDPVGRIAALAEESGLWLHVDGCLGGMALPFLRELGPSIPEFDFLVPGVTSISADLHKYGYAVKGISTVYFRDAALQRYQHFVYEDRIAGYYETPNIAGTRSGGAISAAWAVMQYLGRDGYLRVAGELLAIKRALIAGIEAIEELEIRGQPHAFHFTFGSGALDILAVDAGMTDRGWSGGLGGEPPSIWLMVNLTHAGIVDDYLRDLAEVVELVKAGKIEGRGQEVVYASKN